MISTTLFTTLMTVLLIVPSCDTTHKCAKCIAGNFLDRRDIMENPHAQAPWGDGWSGTDCEKGKFTVMICELSCLTVIMTRKTDEGIFFDGFLRECSHHPAVINHDSLHSLSFRNNQPNSIIHSKFEEFNITYIVSERSPLHRCDLIDEFKSFNFTMYPKSEPLHYIWSFLIDLFVIVLVVALAVVLVGVLCVLLKWSRRERTISEIAMMEVPAFLKI